MRLIDADALKRYEQKIATEAWKMKVKASVESTLNQFIDHIDHAPDVDAVPVVRCKDCIHWGKFPVSTVFPQYHKCGMATYKSTKGDDFCSDGKDDDNG